MSKRFFIKDSNYDNPGPGAYLRFSEFGVLVPKNKNKSFAAVRYSNTEEKSMEKDESKN